MVVGAINSVKRDTKGLPSDVIQDYDPKDCRLPASKEGETFIWRRQESKLDFHRHAIVEIEQGLKSAKSWSWLPQMQSSATSKVFTILDRPSSCIIGQILGMILMLIILLSVVCFVASTAEGIRPEGEDRSRDPFFMTVEVISIWIFFFEYLLRLLTVSSVPTVYLRQSGYNVPRVTKSLICLREEGIQIILKLYYFIFDLMNIIDLVSCIPILTYFSGRNHQEFLFVKILRLTRGLRLIKVGSLRENLWWFRGTISEGRVVLTVVFILIFVSSFIFTFMIYWAERGEYNEEKGYFERVDLYGDGKERSPFSSLEICAWWVVCTTTGVGYGDVVPTTAFGWIVGILCMYGGILSLALPLATIAMHLGETKSTIDEENRMLELSAIPWDDNRSPDILYDTADEMLSVTDEMIRLNKAMQYCVKKYQEGKEGEGEEIMSGYLPPATLTRGRKSLQLARMTRDGNEGKVHCTSHQILPPSVTGEDNDKVGGKGEIQSPNLQQHLEEKACHHLQSPSDNQRIDRILGESPKMPQKSAVSSAHSASSFAHVQLSQAATKFKTISASMPFSSKRKRMSFPLHNNNSKKISTTRSLPELRPGLFNRIKRNFTMEDTGKPRRSFSQSLRDLINIGSRRKLPRDIDKRSVEYMENLTRLTEQANMLLNFTDVILTRTKATVVSRVFQEEKFDGKVRIYCPSWLCCRRKSSKQDGSSNPGDSEGWGWDYEPCKHRLRLQLPSSRVTLNLSTRGRLGLAEQAAQTGVFKESVRPSRKTSGGADLLEGSENGED